MKHLLLVTIICFYTISLLAQEQEKSLETFVAEKQSELIYDASKLVTAPNTNVQLIPPEHFIADPDINGFSHPGSGTTIQILEIPNLGHRSIEQGMTPEYIENQGYEFIEKVELTTETGKRAVIYFVKFETNVHEFERAMLFTGENKTIWVNVNYPSSMKKLLYPAIEATLKSVQ
ncbi:MAG: hypothetical protein PHF99_09905 [Bacteroidales bacterium]|jgi:hypothetical protein|nr:hypothetical protein [Bacteroidales bacterium]MDD4236313.1 hypothetical protein [Bacteroidales bacterium]